MRWCTRALIHYDRVAAAWLIVRFVDPEAQFLFVTPNDPVPGDAEPFGLPGVVLAAQDGETTTFERVLTRYSLNDPALLAMARIVSDTVKHVMHDPDRAALGWRDPHVLGVLAVTEGVMLDSASDEECLTRSMPLFDALHARMQAHPALARDHATPLEETRSLVARVALLRANNDPFSAEALAAAMSRPDECTSNRDDQR